MSEQAREMLQLHGRVFITCNIKVVTGLHIGGSDEGIQIGGIDNTVIRNPFTQEPYIPGSSLRGKMRSELDKLLGLPRNQRIGQVWIHTCQNQDDYVRCDVCRVFGVPGSLPGQEEYGGPTRLVVRDVALTPQSKERLTAARLDLPYAEIKTEVAIDRVTSAATPRTMERVPAGAIFGPAQLVFSVYESGDFGLLPRVVQALQLVEDSYLGGQGSRGSGQVRFTDVEISVRGGDQYAGPEEPVWTGRTVGELAAGLDEVIARARSAIPAG